MKTQVTTLIALLALGACAKPTTTGQWSCRAVGNGTCSDIAAIDRAPVAETELLGGPPERKSAASIIDGAAPARTMSIYDTAGPPAIEAPVRQSDQVVRVVVAPWVDQSGNYFNRQEVYTVVRKGAWWVKSPGEPRYTTRASYVAPTAAPAIPSRASQARPVSPVATSVRGKTAGFGGLAMIPARIYHFLFDKRQG